MATTHNQHDQDERIASNPELVEFLYRELNMDVGAALKHAREARQLLQADIARMIGVQQSRISQIESTKGISMTLDVLARYVSALRYRLDVDIVDPETDELVSSLPVVPLNFMPVEETERRSRIAEEDLHVSVGSAAVTTSATSRPTQPATQVRVRSWMAPEERDNSDYLAAA